MDIIQKRFDELDKDAEAISAGRNTREGCITVPYVVGGPVPAQPRIADVDQLLLLKWQTSVLSLLERVFGRRSSTFERLYQHVNAKLGSPNVDYAKRFDEQRAIFFSAKSEYEGGYLFDVQNLVRAEVFSDELEQAKHFLDRNHKVPAAVVAGVVLETTLRKLCDRHDELKPADNLNRMNDDLAKAAVYNKMRADQVRAWAKVRNSAAHGHPEEFDEGDVERMIDGVRDFVAAQLS